MAFPLKNIPPRRAAIWVAILSVLIFAGVQGLMAWNARMTPAKIAAGEALFTHEWSVNDSLCGSGDGLGPVFNERSCVACHSQGGIGGAGGNEFNVLAFDVEPAEGRKNFVSHVVHSQAISPEFQEDQANVQRLFPFISKWIISQIPSYGDCGNGPPQTREIEVKENPVIYHELNSPQLFGVGLIDEISSAAISMHGTRRATSRLQNEFAGKFTGNSIGITRVTSGGIGKFGWKGQFASLEDFVASACAMEIGLTNPLHAQPVPREHMADRNAKMDMTRKQLHELVCFVRSLPAPVQVLPDDETARVRVRYGEQIFGKVGCADCHVRDLGHVNGIYSDFHLYNLEDFDSVTDPYGEAPEDESLFNFQRSQPDRDQWQTPPLWGVADTAPYFHDGRSPTLEKAILRHKGQAIHSRKAYKSLSSSDRAAMIEFLETLRAPANAARSGDRKTADIALNSVKNR